MFLAGFTLAFLVFYAVSPMIFRTSVCCGAHGIGWVHLLVSVIIGLFGGFLGFRLYRLGVFTIGECLGMIVALVVLSSPLKTYFRTDTSYACFMAAVSVAFGSLAHFYEKPIVVLSTVVSGSLAFFYGLDYFLRTSFSVTVEHLLLRIRDVVEEEVKSEYSNWMYRPHIPDHLAVKLTHNAFPVFVAWGISVAIGMIVQYRVTANKEREKDVFSWCNCCDRPRPDK
ncbi:uncharacterized protein LOC116615405 isoform X2 [Nematostella vectensis]|nr:uncharacterized protein LOC116615405 isoform X2 [Nematostella vectensis]